MVIKMLIMIISKWIISLNSGDFYFFFSFRYIQWACVKNKMKIVPDEFRKQRYHCATISMREKKIIKHLSSKLDWLIHTNKIKMFWLQVFNTMTVLSLYIFVLNIYTHMSLSSSSWICRKRPNCWLWLDQVMDQKYRTK